MGEALGILGRRGHPGVRLLPLVEAQAVALARPCLHPKSACEVGKVGLGAPPSPHPGGRPCVPGGHLSSTAPPRNLPSSRPQDRSRQEGQELQPLGSCIPPWLGCAGPEGSEPSAGGPNSEVSSATAPKANGMLGTQRENHLECRGRYSCKSPNLWKLSAILLLLLPKDPVIQGQWPEERSPRGRGRARRGTPRLCSLQSG